MQIKRKKILIVVDNFYFITRVQIGGLIYNKISKYGHTKYIS